MLMRPVGLYLFDLWRLSGSNKKIIPLRPLRLCGECNCIVYLVSSMAIR